MFTHRIKNTNYFVCAFLLLISISMLSCQKKSPIEPKESEIIISSNVVKFDEETVNSIVSVDTSGVITFSKQTSVLKKLQEGNIIFSQPIEAAPDGFLKKVTNFSSSGNQVVVSTVDATFEETFERAVFSFNKSLTMGDLESSLSLKKGVSIKRSSNDGFLFPIEDVVLYDLDGSSSTTDDQILARGQFEINPSFHLILEIENFTIKKFKFYNSTEEIANLEISCGVSLSYEPEVRLAELTFSPITIWVGYVPIVIRPVLYVDCGAKVSASAHFTTGVTQTASLQAGVEYSNDQWKPISRFDLNFVPNPPELETSLYAKGYIGPQLNLMFYGVAGPYTDLNAYLQLEANIFQTPWWELYGGFDVGVGVEVQFLGKQIFDQYFPEIIKYHQKIASAEGVLEGTIVGVVKDAINLYPLDNVKIEVKKDGNILAQTLSNYNGEFSVDVQVGENYIVEFSKTGYIAVTYENIQVAGNSENHLEPILQIDQNYSGAGNIRGAIFDALSGNVVPNISLALRRGINNQSGTVVATARTASNGEYVFYNIEAGNYTVEAGANNYTTTYFSVICIGGQTTYGQNATISPLLSDDEIRIILTWGEYPEDLDSHLTGPTPDGYRFHTYWDDMSYYYDDQLYVQLDIDDVSSWGPETTTIYHSANGLYRFSVHDYTNREASYSTALSNSGAQVRVYKGSELSQTFYVPTNTEGTLWTVFEMFGSTIVPRNIMSYESSPGSIRKVSQQETDAHLLRGLPDKP